MLLSDERTEFDRLARDELPGLRALARQLERGDADDLVQESMLRACRSFGSLRDPAAAPAWLRTILRNVWRDRVRARHAGPSIELSDDPEALPPLMEDTGTEPPLYADTLHLADLGRFNVHDVRVVLARLPRRYRAPLVRHYLHGYATQEIADELDLPLGTVLSQLHRGRQRFARALASYAAESGLLDDDDDEHVRR